jgi:acetyltransferase
MSAPRVHSLESLFHPQSVAVIGASNRPHSVGATVMRNLLAGGFPGPIMPVNPRHTAVAGVLAYPDVSALPTPPELAVICTPPLPIPGIIDELGRGGTKAAVVLTAGLSAIHESTGRTLKEAMLATARPHGLRILGPNCVGLIIPGCGLNASFAPTAALPGNVAFLSQSGALTTAVLDWATSRGIGFSHFVSLGDSADIDFGDVLDYLGSDPTTRAILLYIESIREARRFMSAARAASRNKPVLVIKAGRAPEGARAAASHTGALAGSDDVFDAAIRRAGMLRVYSIEELFDAVETLARARPLTGERLAILTNGGGPGVMAADALCLGQGQLAALSPATLAALDAGLPATWSRGNPVDIIGDAPVERYVATLQTLLGDPGCDAVLLIQAPTAIVPSDEIARAVAPVAARAERNVLACWLGGNSIEAARQIFWAANLPTYETPEHAVRAFRQIIQYRQNQELLTELPASTLPEFQPDSSAARALIQLVLADGRNMLNEIEAKDLLSAYGIPIVKTRFATSPDEAAHLAGEIGFPVVLKILSPDISHKSDVGGVALDLEAADNVKAAADAMLGRVGKLRPDARIAGFSVQQMAHRPRAHELIIGIATDPVFGPVILFGHGGTAVEVVADRAIGLPPLNFTLARELVLRTRVSRLLAGYRDRPPADMAAIFLTLTQVSQLAIDLPEIVELDINPLLADDQGVVALDARVRVAHPAQVGVERLAILPYPRELEEMAHFDGHELLLRPVRPEDENAYRAFFAALEPEDIRFRFFSTLRELPRSQIARATQIDYSREMTIVAIDRTDPHRGLLGVVQAMMDPDNVEAEFAIMVRSDLKGRGLGRILLHKIIDYCRARGVREIVGEVVPSNHRMLRLATEMGFSSRPCGEPDAISLRLLVAPEAQT